MYNDDWTAAFSSGRRRSGKLLGSFFGRVEAKE
jgi:hypothetical protein